MGILHLVTASNLSAIFAPLPPVAIITAGLRRTYCWWIRGCNDGLSDKGSDETVIVSSYSLSGVASDSAPEKEQIILLIESPTKMI